MRMAREIEHAGHPGAASMEGLDFAQFDLAMNLILLSDEASFITGAALPVDGGTTA